MLNSLKITLKFLFVNLIAVNSIAQDVIIKSTGERINCAIISVNDKQVAFKIEGANYTQYLGNTFVKKIIYDQKAETKKEDDIPKQLIAEEKTTDIEKILESKEPLENIEESKNDVLDKRLHYEMGKTGHFKSIKLNAESKTILKSYKRSNAKPDDFLFPLLANDLDYSDPEFLRGQVESKAAMINGELKKLAVAAKVEKRIHFHSSRHSFTDLARKKGADIYNISKALAHQSIPATENYLKDFDEESLDKTMDMIFKKQATK